MPLTQLDTVAALIVIDLQKGLLQMPLAHPTREMVSNAAKLAHEFRKRGSPVVLVKVTSRAPGRTDQDGATFPSTPEFSELVPELMTSASDLLVTKQHPGAFLGTPLHAMLRERKVTQVFLAGIATSRGVQATAFSAYDLGYNVVFVSDAISDRDAEAHQYCMTTTFPRIGEVDTTERVLWVLRTDRL